jgi:hypothetical protein
MYNQIGWVWVTGRTPAEPADIEPKPPGPRGTEYALNTANGHRRLTLYGGVPPLVLGFEEESAPVMLLLSGALTPGVHVRATLLASLLTSPHLRRVEKLCSSTAGPAASSCDITSDHARSGCGPKSSRLVGRRRDEIAGRDLP